MRRAAVLSLLLALLGCPAKTQPAGGEANLALSLGSSGDVACEGPAAVGSSAALRVSLPQGAEAQQLFGALLASEPARVTVWHAEPADAVTFDGNKAKFARSGAVKVWATWVDARGRELSSNELTFRVD